jgi:hypothetical protein
MMARGTIRPSLEDIDGAVIAAIVEACAHPLRTDLVHNVAERLSDIDRPDAIDKLIDRLSDLDSINVDRLAGLARWLCNFGVHRGQVKSGIGLLGVSGSAKDADLLGKLGLLDELTLYAVVALRRLLPDWEHEIFDLAKHVDGWGRVEAIEFLRGAEDPAVKDWLLRIGYNIPGNEEEVALNAATFGGLAATLQGEVDEELLDHIGEILGTLATAEHGGTMADYESGGLAMELYLSQIATMPKTIARLRIITFLRDYLEGDAQYNSKIEPAIRASLRQSAVELLSSSDWARIVEASLHSPDFEIVRQVVELAPSYGLDRAPIVFRWLSERERDSYLWWLAAHDADLPTLLELVDVAEKLFDFDDLPSGPRLSLGLGPAFAASVCLQTLLQELGRFPGQGWKAIQYGLFSDLFRSRNVSARALEKWTASDFPKGAAAILAGLAAAEPDDELKARLADLSTRAGSIDD